MGKKAELQRRIDELTTETEQLRAELRSVKQKKLLDMDMAHVPDEDFGAYLIGHMLPQMIPFDPEECEARIARNRRLRAIAAKRGISWLDVFFDQVE